MLKVFVSLMLRKYTLWLNFLSYKRPQCTSYPFLPVAKYFDLWWLEWLRESNKIFANIISFFLCLPFLPLRKGVDLSFTVDVENLEIWQYFQGMLNTQDIINPFLIFNKYLIKYCLEVHMLYSCFTTCPGLPPDFRWSLTYESHKSSLHKKAFLLTLFAQLWSAESFEQKIPVCKGKVLTMAACWSSLASWAPQPLISWYSRGSPPQWAGIWRRFETLARR